MEHLAYHNLVDLSSLEAGSEDTKEKKSSGSRDDIASLIGVLKLALGEEISDVRESSRLKNSPVCMVAEEGAIDIHLERLLKQQNRLNKEKNKNIYSRKKENS